MSIDMLGSPVDLHRFTKTAWGIYNQPGPSVSNIMQITGLKFKPSVITIEWQNPTMNRWVTTTFFDPRMAPFANDKIYEFIVTNSGIGGGNIQWSVPDGGFSINTGGFSGAGNQLWDYAGPVKWQAFGEVKM